jgi:putative endonuclease
MAKRLTDGPVDAGPLTAGQVAERIARARLENSGLEFVCSNYNCRFGELDLVMRDRNALVVVEVRYRRHTVIMHPVDSITPAKIRRIARATRHFLSSHPRWRNVSVRFDVIGLHGSLAHPEMNWIRGAFTIDDN